jgi:hypothetical protein
MNCPDHYPLSFNLSDTNRSALHLDRFDGLTPVGCVVYAGLVAAFTLMFVVLIALDLSGTTPEDWGRIHKSLFGGNR